MEEEKNSESVEDVGSVPFGSLVMEEEIKLESIEDVGSGPSGSLVMEEEEKASSKERKELEFLDKGRDAHLVVAALIATVTFAAAFTLPGGYKNEQGPHQGTAVLAKKAAFIVFVISDAIAMALSISAVFIHFWMVLLQYWMPPDNEDEMEANEKTSYRLFGFASLLTTIAMITMVIAFITGIYAVLTTSLWLAITTCIIGLSFFLLVYIVSGCNDDR